MATRAEPSATKAMPMGSLRGLRPQVLWDRLQSIVDEQASTLMRTAFSPIVRESGDLSAGVFDRRGRMLVQAVTGTPGHVNTMAAAVGNLLPYFPAKRMRPGDLYATNDPWIGAGHLNDLVLVRPCFAGAELVGYLACTSHLVDIGGRCLGPDGEDVYDEGFYVPPLKLLDRGRLDRTFMTLLKANSRTPDEAEGDVHALIACCEVAAKRLDRCLREFAVEGLDEVADHIVQSSGVGTRARIAALPDGTWRSEMTVDGYDFELRLRAALTVAGDGLSVDYAGSPGLSRHGINVPLNYARAYTVFALKCVLAPDIPNNAGSLAPFMVSAPQGSLLNAPKPCPVCSRHIVGQLLPDVVFGCLAQVLPERVPAEGASTLWDLPIRGGYAPRGANASGRTYAIELVHNGGTGARPTKDGLSATAFPSGVMGSLVEVTESVTPLVVWRRELAIDSGGAGRFRGGLGQIIELGTVDGSPFQLFGTVDRIRHPARGRAGGLPGRVGRMGLASGTRFPGKGAFEVPGRDRLIVRTPGGGGHGDPFARDPEGVRRDVAAGLVSREAAARDYGVAVGADGSVDAAETARLRARPRSAFGGPSP